MPRCRRCAARGGGAIVATASLAGLTAVPFDPLYAANKHAVVGLVRSLGLLEQEGIRVNAVCPGFAESKIIDPIREGLAEAGLPIIPAEQVAATVVDAVRRRDVRRVLVRAGGARERAVRVPRDPGPSYLRLFVAGHQLCPGGCASPTYVWAPSAN